MTRDVIHSREGAIMARLTDRQKDVYCARVNRGLTQPDIAAELDCNERTVRRDLVIIRQVIADVAGLVGDDKQTERSAERAEIMRLSEVDVEFRDTAAVDTTLRTVLLEEQKKTRPSRKWDLWRQEQRENGAK